MREIKFRGLNFGGVWYYSDKSSLLEFFLLVEAKDSSPVIKKNTVGQYTGLKDKNGKEIYEGDILKWLREPKGKKEGSEFVMGEVKFEHQGWWCANAPKEDGQWNSPGFNFAFMLNLVEVIGNIYENPELLDTQDKGSEV